MTLCRLCDKLKQIYPEATHSCWREENVDKLRLATHVACDREKALHIMGVVPLENKDVYVWHNQKEEKEKKASQPQTKYWAAYCSFCGSGLEGKNHTKEAIEIYVGVHNKIHSTPTNAEANAEETRRRKLGLRSARFINQPEWNSDYD